MNGDEMMENQNANTMQTNTCQCPSFSSGVATGIGVGVGLGIAAGITAGLFHLLKKK